MEALLDSRAIGLVMGLEFARKQRFKIERPIYVRNVDRTFNKKEPIEHIMEVNIYYQRHRERIKIDVIGRTEVEHNSRSAVMSKPQS